MLAGQLDVGIAFHPTSRAEIETEHLFTEQLQLLVGPEHKLARRRSLPMKQLDGVPLCLLPRSFATRRMLEDCFRAAGCSPAVRVEMESVNALINACASGDLATIVPQRAAAMATGMRAIVLTDPQPARHAGILWRKGASRSVAAQAFAALLVGPG